MLGEINAVLESKPCEGHFFRTLAVPGGEGGREERREGGKGLKIIRPAPEGREGGREGGKEGRMATDRHVTYLFAKSRRIISVR